ncbi:MAG: hemolysin family protein [Christensenellales bacterium]
MDDYLPYVIAIAVLLCLSAFFSASEMAFSSINRIRLKKYKDDGDKRAERTLKIANDFDNTLSTVLVGNNIVNIAAATLGTLLFTNLMGPAGAAWSTIVITVIVLIFGEILPKAFAKETPERFALAVSGILYVAIIILKPVVFFFVFIKRIISKLFHLNKSTSIVTEEELKYIVEEIESEGIFDEQESDLIQSALDFNEIIASEVLTPRVDVVGVDIDDDPQTIKHKFLLERYSRLPVFNKKIDDIIGVLHVKDFFTAYLHKTDIDIRSFMQPVLYIPPQKKIADLLAQLQKIKSHMAVVTDQYGGTVGIVTMEDILEELVGEIWDEDDEIIKPVVELEKDLYSIQADSNIDDVFEFVGFVDDQETDMNTIGGWAMEKLGRIPENNESFAYENLDITVTQVEDQRVMHLLIHVYREEPTESDTE